MFRHLTKFFVIFTLCVCVCVCVCLCLFVCLCLCRSSLWAVQGSNMCVGQQQWLWGSPVPWCQMTFPDSALCHFMRERASPFLPQQKVLCVYMCLILKRMQKINSFALLGNGEHFSAFCIALCVCNDFSRGLLGEEVSLNPRQIESE